MNIVSKPAARTAIKRVLLPLAAATVVALPTLAAQNKTENIPTKIENFEYLQADKYEKMGDARIQAGLTQEEAYKDEALKTKFDIANLNGDYKISQSEADIYNWGGKIPFPNYYSIQHRGLVLCSRNGNGGPEYCVYPGQKYSESMYSNQKRLFKELDYNNDQIASPTEILHQIKKMEHYKINMRIAEANSEIKKAEKYITNPDMSGAKDKAALTSFWIFAGIAAAIGGAARSSKAGCLSMLAGLASAVISYNLMVNFSINKNEDRWNGIKTKAILEKEIALKEQAKTKQELDFLDEQLKYENLSIQK